MSRTVERTKLWKDIECTSCQGTKKHLYEEHSQKHLARHWHLSCKHEAILKTRWCCEEGGRNLRDNWLQLIRKPASGHWYSKVILPVNNTSDTRILKGFLDDLLKKVTEKFANSKEYNKVYLGVLHKNTTLETIQEEKEEEEGSSEIEYTGDLDKSKQKPVIRGEKGEETLQKFKFDRKGRCLINRPLVNHIHLYYIKTHSRRGIHGEVLELLETTYKDELQDTIGFRPKNPERYLEYLQSGSGRHIHSDQLQGAVFARMGRIFGGKIDEKVTSGIETDDSNISQLSRDLLRKTSAKPGVSDGEMEIDLEGASQESESDNQEEQWELPDQDEGFDVRGRKRGGGGKNNGRVVQASQQEKEEESTTTKRRRRDAHGRFIKEDQDGDEHTSGNRQRVNQGLTKMLAGWLSRPSTKVANSNQFKKLANKFPEKFMDGEEPEILMINLMSQKKFDIILDLSIDAKFEKTNIETWYDTLNRIDQLQEDVSMAQYYYPEETYWDPKTSEAAIIHMIAKNSWPLKKFLDEITMVVDRQEQKINTLVFQGEPNTGKTKMAESIAEAFEFRSTASNFTKKNAFPLGDCYQSRIIVANEMRIDEENGEIALQFLEGSEMEVNVKNKKQMKMKRTPVIITTNINIWGYCPTKRLAMEKRIKLYYFEPCKEYKFTLRKKLHPLGWKFIKDTVQDIEMESEGNDDIEAMKIELYIEEQMKQANALDLTCYEKLTEQEILSKHEQT